MADLTFDNLDLTLYCRNVNQIEGFNSYKYRFILY